MKMLKALYDGSIESAVKFFHQDSEYIDLLRLREKSREKLLQRLSEEEKEIFGNFTARQCDLDEIVQYEKFSNGFRIGALLMADAYSAREDL